MFDEAAAINDVNAREIGETQIALLGELRRIPDCVLTAWAAELSSRFSLEGESIGALEVQEMSRSEGLEPDELSRSLVQAREE